MSVSDQSPEWFDERVEGYVDGMLSREELQVFEAQLSDDAQLRQCVEEARLVVSVLHSFPEVDCPPAVTDRVMDAVRESTAREAMPRSSAGSGDRPAVRMPSRLRLVQAATFLAAACLAWFVIIGPADSTSETVYTDAEVERALREAKFALAVVSGAGRDAGRAIRMDAVSQASDAMRFVLVEPTVPDGNN